VQPTGNGIGLSDGLGLACQYKERGLEDILGIVLVLNDALTDTQDHRAMPVHQSCKCRLVILDCEALQKGTISLMTVKARCGDSPNECQ
jgi:hypothetical protein